MCDSLAEGGTRCAAHTRPAYEQALADMGDRATDVNAYNQMWRDGWEGSIEAQGIYDRIAEYASTPKGFKEVGAQVEEWKKVGGKINKFAMFMQRARQHGTELAAQHKQLKADLKREKARREGHRGGGAGTGSVEELKPSVGTTSENNCLAVYPDIGQYWRAEDNQGIGPDQVRPGSNGQLKWRCPRCHTLTDNPSFRVNSLTSTLAKGGQKLCETCDPRRRAQFKASQEEVASLADALGDPDLFHTLPQTIQYKVMEMLGMTKGKDTDMNRALGMSLVHGDLTLSEVVAAKEFNDVAERIRDINDEDELDEVTDLTQATVPVADQDAATRAAQALDAARVLDVIDSESDLAASISRELNEQMWEAAYTAPDPEAFLAYIESRRGRSGPSDAALDRFQAEYAAVAALELPEGYVAERTSPEGLTKTLDPNLSQRRFVTMALERRKIMNWSGTGAGKTLSASLAVQAAGSRETLVVCPKAVLGQWGDEFAQGYPDNTEVRFGLPSPGEKLSDLPEGVNRVWVVNYDKFQKDSETLKAELNDFAGRVDAIVFDEIHKAKTSENTGRSLRRSNLEAFTDKVRRNNDDLVIIGASATPVINDLSEAQSVLRLVEGPGSKKFPTKNTIKNAALAYQRLSGAGVRTMPKYTTKLNRVYETIDVTPKLRNIQAYVTTRANDRASAKSRVNPADMEQALLPYKMPKLVELAEKNKTTGAGPTVIYTEYTTGMVDPMRKGLEAKGLRVATYLGTDSAKAREATLAAFKRGEYDVLIGSRPISTGVDGLQNISSNLIVASMPWTAADDEQLVGRFQRFGQKNDVNVTYLLTEAKVGEARWSWCQDNRRKRIEFKRGMANAAVDGVLPDGIMENQQSSTENALSKLGDLIKAA